MSSNRIAINPERFKAVLHRFGQEVEAESPPATVVREVVPPPVLCPSSDSLLRFMPLVRNSTSPLTEGLGRGWEGDKYWTYVDFASFEGAEFAYAVCRSLLHRSPSKKQIRIAESGSTAARLMLVLAADRKARRNDGPGNLANLSGTRMLYLAFRTARKLKLAPLTAILQMLINVRARRLLEINRDMLVQRRLSLTIIDLLSGRL